MRDTIPSSYGSGELEMKGFVTMAGPLVIEGKVPDEIMKLFDDFCLKKIALCYEHEDGRKNFVVYFQPFNVSPPKEEE